MSKGNQGSPDEQTTSFPNYSNMESQKVLKELKDAIVIIIYKKDDQKKHVGNIDEYHYSPPLENSLPGSF